jgi:hypothetical protein
VVGGRSRRRLAALAVVVLAGAACLGFTWDSSRTADRGHETTAVVAHHHTAASMHLDGVAAIATVAVAALLWSTERVSRRRAHVPLVTSMVRRRGPPLLLAY